MNSKLFNVVSKQESKISDSEKYKTQNEERLIEHHLKEMDKKIDIVNRAILQSAWLEYYIIRMQSQPEHDGAFSSRSLSKQAENILSNPLIARSSRTLSNPLTERHNSVVSSKS